jgi:hypothetical protein
MKLNPELAIHSEAIACVWIAHVPVRSNLRNMVYETSKCVEVPQWQPHYIQQMTCPALFVKMPFGPAPYPLCASQGWQRLPGLCQGGTLGRLVQVRKGKCLEKTEVWLDSLNG